MYNVRTHDFYKDLENNSTILTKLDTSNLPTDHPCYCIDRKKLPGTFKDETNGGVIREMIALRAKSYGYDLAGVETIKAKGIQRHVVKHHMTIEDHKKCLFWTGALPDTETSKSIALQHVKQFKDTGTKSNDYTPFRVNTSLRSFKHQMKTISSIKLAFNNHDDKRFILEDRIHTLAHGHFKIE